MHFSIVVIPLQLLLHNLLRCEKEEVASLEIMGRRATSGQAKNFQGGEMEPRRMRRLRKEKITEMKKKLRNIRRAEIGRKMREWGWHVSLSLRCESGLPPSLSLSPAKSLTQCWASCSAVRGLQCARHVQTQHPQMRYIAHNQDAMHVLNIVVFSQSRA